AGQRVCELAAHARDGLGAREREGGSAPHAPAVPREREEEGQEQERPRVREAEAHATSGSGSVCSGSGPAPASTRGRSKDATQSRAACHSSIAAAGSG